MDRRREEIGDRTEARPTRRNRALPRQKLALLLAAFVASLLAVEFVLPVFVEITDDVEYEHLPGVGLHLRPAQQGVYLRDAVGGADRIRARFHVNNAGFNSLHAYSMARRAGVRRVVVVGDSFVEALQVDPEAAFHSVLEGELRNAGVHVEVYAFGVSGFGISQAYHLIQEYVLAYSPDLVIYLFIPGNDVEDSSVCHGINRWSQQYDIGEDDRLTPIRFEPYSLPLSRWALRRSRMFRYLYYQRRLAERILFWRGARRERGSILAFDSCVEKSWRIAGELLHLMDQSLTGANVPWLLVWQGDADPSYHAEKRLRLEAIAAQRSLPYFDPSESFRRDFAARGKRFRIAGDGHWNANGHRVAGEALAPLARRKLEDGDSSHNIDAR